MTINVGKKVAILSSTSIDCMMFPFFRENSILNIFYFSRTFSNLIFGICVCVNFFSFTMYADVKKELIKFAMQLVSTAENNNLTKTKCS